MEVQLKEGAIADSFDAVPPHALLEPRRPFLLLVFVLLAAVGSSTAVGVFGLFRLDRTTQHVGLHDVRRLLVVTHVRRLFRSELLLLEQERRGDLPPGDEGAEERLRAIEAEREALLDELAGLVEPSEQRELAELRRQHDLGRGLIEQESQPWEPVIATLLAATDLRPICTVSHSDTVTTARGQRYWFHAASSEITPNDATTGRVMGTATRAMKAKWPYPSSLAASSRSLGMPMKPWRIRKMPNAVARNGAVSPG